jgi:uncharacterized protein YeeX (DUF496 family)
MAFPTDKISETSESSFENYDDTLNNYIINTSQVSKQPKAKSNPKCKIGEKRVKSSIKPEPKTILNLKSKHRLIFMN